MQKRSEWMNGRNAMVVGLVLASACGVDGSADQPAPAPIAQVALDNGGVVEFYEASPGALVIVQEAPRGAADVTGTAASAVALYEQLAPGEAVPPALVAAQARAVSAHASRPARASKPAVQQLANNATFSSTYCSGSWDVIHCRLDRNSGFWAQYNSTDAARCTVSSDVGTVTLRMLVDGDLEISRDVLAGHTITASYDSGLFNDQVRCEATNVNSTDRYDLGFRFNIN
jgi:hypothetical protein